MDKAVRDKVFITAFLAFFAGAFVMQEFIKKKYNVNNGQITKR